MSGDQTGPAEYNSSGQLTNEVDRDTRPASKTIRDMTSRDWESAKAALDAFDAQLGRDR